MSEGKIHSEHSPDPSLIADGNDRSSPSALVVNLSENKSDASSGRRGRVALLIVLMIAAIISYIGSLALLYGHRGKPDVELIFAVASPEPPLDLTLNVLSLDPVREVINVRIEVVKPSETRSWSTLKPEDMRDFVINVDDRYLTFQIAAEGSGAKAVLEIALNGSISAYPLDRYAGHISISASKKGSDVSQPIRLTVWPLLSNWNVEVSRSDQVSETPTGVDLNIRVKRPTSFIVMAFAFYVAMALIGLSGLTIGTLVFLGVRPVEAALTGALGAMIFSIPALRGIMPGAPPLGVHADALILVWVEMGVIVGLTLFVITWVWRHRPASDRAAAASRVRT
jgi:Domain of unknown function (DUF4436)